MSAATGTAPSDGQTGTLPFTPFHAAGVVYIAVGLLFAIYRGLMEFDLVTSVG